MEQGEKDIILILVSKFFSGVGDRRGGERKKEKEDNQFSVSPGTDNAMFLFERLRPEIL